VKEELNNLKNNALAQIIEAGGINTLEELRISYLGRNGSVNKFFKELGKLDSDDRKDFGILLNETKKTILNICHLTMATNNCDFSWQPHRDSCCIRLVEVLTPKYSAKGNSHNLKRKFSDTRD